VGREALESSSAVLQTAAIPSQLPAQATRGVGADARPQKKARRRSDAGPWWLNEEFGQASPAPFGIFGRVIELFVRLLMLHKQRARPSGDIRRELKDDESWPKHGCHSSY
jgi:hypothetical protein